MPIDDYVIRTNNRGGRGRFRPACFVDFTIPDKAHFSGCNMKIPHKPLGVRHILLCLVILCPVFFLLLVHQHDHQLGRSGGVDSDDSLMKEALRSSMVSNIPLIKGKDEEGQSGLFTINAPSTLDAPLIRKKRRHDDAGDTTTFLETEDPFLRSFSLQRDDVFQDRAFDRTDRLEVDALTSDPTSNEHRVRETRTTRVKRALDDERDAVELLELKDPLLSRDALSHDEAGHDRTSAATRSEMDLEDSKKTGSTRKEVLPTLENIVQDWNITGDPSWLLDMSVIGFPKCGTTTLMYHLESHPEIQMFTKERCDLGTGQQVTLIRDLYAEVKRDPQQKRGIKCPRDLESHDHSLPIYRQYFPNTKLIVGIRHPVLWFESFYNCTYSPRREGTPAMSRLTNRTVRVQNGHPMKHPNEFIGLCSKYSWHLCTVRGVFNLYLGNLGKTPMSDDERSLVPKQYRRFIKPQNVTNPVFLYDMSQLSSDEESFRQDLQSYLGLKEPIPPMIWMKPGKNVTDTKIREERESAKIDICDDGYEMVRQVLMEHSISAATWIRDFFLESSDVVVSSRDVFKTEILDAWMKDPCLERRVSSSM